MIMEQAFVSNAIDAVFLSSEENLKALGVADATATAEYYGLRLKTSLHGLSDALEEACHYQEIGWLASAGITLGFSDGSYGVGGSVARGDLAVFLYRLNSGVGRVAASRISIMGDTTTNAIQLAAYFAASGFDYPAEVYEDKGAATIEEFARIMIEEAQVEGVRAEVVFCQAMKETGWLQFGGDVKAEQCNFAGIGAVGGGAGGATFSDVRTGVRAQVQHLKAYASIDDLANDCVGPRFNLVTRGCAPYLTGLNGR